MRLFRYFYLFALPGLFVNVASRCAPRRVAFVFGWCFLVCVWPFGFGRRRRRRSALDSAGLVLVSGRFRAVGAPDSTDRNRLQVSVALCSPFFSFSLLPPRLSWASGNLQTASDWTTTAQWKWRSPLCLFCLIRRSSYVPQCPHVLCLV